MEKEKNTKYDRRNLRIKYFMYYCFAIFIPFGILLILRGYNIVSENEVYLGFLVLFILGLVARVVIDDKVNKKYPKKIGAT